MQKRKQVQAMGNGHLILPLKGTKHYIVWGGPYRSMPTEFVNLIGVKLAPEIFELRAVIDFPIRDFSVPSVSSTDAQLPQIVRAILSGAPVYFGCMGGRGRTGLVLALVAKAFGIQNPVEFVRENYFHHAVETRDQYQFVKGYRIPDEVLELVDRAKSPWNWRNWFKDRLTDLPV
jgi:hypothetical protein